MAKIINNGKWYTGDEYNEIYHDMIFGGGAYGNHQCNQSKIRG